MRSIGIRQGVPNEAVRRRRCRRNNDAVHRERDLRDAREIGGLKGQGRRPGDDGPRRRRYGTQGRPVQVPVDEVGQRRQVAGGVAGLEREVRGPYCGDRRDEALSRTLRERSRRDQNRLGRVEVGAADREGGGLEDVAGDPAQRVVRRSPGQSRLAESLVLGSEAQVRDRGRRRSIQDESGARRRRVSGQVAGGQGQVACAFHRDHIRRNNDDPQFVFNDKLVLWGEVIGGLEDDVHVLVRHEAVRRRGQDQGRRGLVDGEAEGRGTGVGEGVLGLDGQEIGAGLGQRGSRHAAVDREPSVFGAPGSGVAAMRIVVHDGARRAVDGTGPAVLRIAAARSPYRTEALDSARDARQRGRAALADGLVESPIDLDAADEGLAVERDSGNKGTEVGDRNRGRQVAVRSLAVAHARDLDRGRMNVEDSGRRIGHGAFVSNRIEGRDQVEVGRVLRKGRMIDEGRGRHAVL